MILLIGVWEPSITPKAEGNVQITGENINIRTGPGLSYDVMMQVQKGKTFSIIKEEGDWYQIQLDGGKKGWVANWLVAKTSSSVKSSGIVTANNLRVRSGPGTENKVLGSINQGDTVEILSEDGSWVKVNTAFGKGWVSKDYIRMKEGQASTQKSGSISANSLNVRATPSLTSKVVGKLVKGAKVSIISEKNGWMEIAFNSQSAWISSEYVTVTAESKTPTKEAETKISGVAGTVTATTLQVRSKGSLNGKVIGTVSKGETYKMLEEANNWVKIELPSGKTGWVAGWYLDKALPNESKSSNGTVKNSRVTIKHDGTNIRTSPDLNSKVLERANSGAEYPIVNIQKDWYEIQLQNGKSGYVAGWIVSVSSGVPQVKKTGSGSGLKNKIIMIDPGHGGSDNGATGAKGTIEKKLTLKTGQLVFNKLKDKGANVILTRSNDQHVSLSSRVSLSHYQNVDAFISIHYDSIDNHTVRGMTTYYYHPHQKELASSVHKGTNAATRLKDRGVRQGNYHVIRENKQNAILLELGYISNPTEELLINTNQYQEQVANGIVQGIANYFHK